MHSECRLYRLSGMKVDNEDLLWLRRIGGCLIIKNDPHLCISARMPGHKLILFYLHQWPNSCLMPQPLASIRLPASCVLATTKSTFWSGISWFLFPGFACWMAYWDSISWRWALCFFLWVLPSVAGILPAFLTGCFIILQYFFFLSVALEWAMCFPPYWSVCWFHWGFIYFSCICFFYSHCNSCLFLFVSSLFFFSSPEAKKRMSRFQ